MELSQDSEVDKPLMHGDCESSPSHLGLGKRRGNRGDKNEEAVVIATETESSKRRNAMLNKRHLCAFAAFVLIINIIYYTSNDVRYNNIMVYFGDESSIDDTKHDSSRIPAPTYQIHDDHHGPTLLSIVDHFTNGFINPSNNELYHFFKPGFIMTPPGDKTITERIYLKLDKNKLKRFGESLKVTIEIKPSPLDDEKKEQVERSDPILNDDDILTMHCSSVTSSSASRTPSEAATLAQVRATTLFHYNRNPNFEWDKNVHTLYIPSFPTIRGTQCLFMLFRSEHGTSYPVLSRLAKSDYVTLPSLDTPTGTHLSLTNDPSEMVVQYTTGSDGDPFVQLIHPENKKATVYEGQTTTYTNEDLCQAPANSTDIGFFIPPGALHTVILKNLIPNTDYTYKVGLRRKGESEITYSQDPHTFKTAPVTGSNDPFAFLAFGDQGCPEDGWAIGGNMSTTMVEHELDNADIPIRAVHHFGDLSYARGNAHLWDAWLDMIQVYSSRVPLMVGIGNHEYDHTGGGLGKDPSGDVSDKGFHPFWGNFRKDSGGECGVPSAKRFYTPQNGNGVFWYSYDMGLVHTVMISSEHSLYPGSRQYKWLKNDLKSVDRNLTPWIVVESHRPMYHSAELGSDQLLVEIGMRMEFEDLLIEHDVDLLLAGHFHSYQRTCSGLYKSKCDNGGLTHITVGTAGAPLDKGYIFSDWSEKLLNVYGYGKVTVFNKTALHWSFISAHGDNRGKALDEVWLTKA